jgi:hypothetical protein
MSPMQSYLSMTLTSIGSKSFEEICMIENHTSVKENHTSITENHTSNIESVNLAVFPGLSLEEKRKILGDMEEQSAKKELFSLLTQEEKKILKDDLKKSIAKMMVYWVAHSRHTLHDDLVADKPDGAWAGLALKGAFGDDEEWRKFFHIASRVFNDEVVTEVETSSGERVRGKIKVVEEGAIRISKRVHGEDGMTNSPVLLPADWESALDPHCPGDDTLDAMYRAAVKFVDDSYPE